MAASVVRMLWERIEARDWAALAALLREDVVIDWPHSGEYWTTARSQAPLAWRSHLTEPMGPA